MVFRSGAFAALILFKDAATRLGWKLNYQPCDHGCRENDASHHYATFLVIADAPWGNTGSMSNF